MLMPSIFGEDLFDDFMGYPTGRQAAANAYPQVKDMMKTDIRDVAIMNWRSIFRDLRKRM